MVSTGRTHDRGGHNASLELDLGMLRAAQSNSRAGCRALVRRYQRPVAALLRRMLRPSGLEHLTEDLAQETFLRTFKALPRFDPDGPARLSTWVLRIAARLAINELKRRRPLIRELHTTIEEHAGEGRADRGHRRAKLARAIENAVGDLAPEFRAAFLLREYHGLEYAEIATTLELELGTVKSRLSRARTSLRKALAEVRDEQA